MKKKLKAKLDKIKRILGYFTTPYKNWFKDESVRKRVRYAKYYKNLKVQENTVLYESFFGRGMVCNPYAMFREMLSDDYYKKFTHIWALENLSDHKVVIDEYKNNKNVKFVEYQSNDYLKALTTSKFLINNNSFHPYYIKKDNQIYINTWHGIPLKKLGYDMVNGAFESKNVVRSFLQTDYIISANDFLTKIYQDSYKIKEIYKGNIIQEGYPRNDLIFSDKNYVIDKLKKMGVNIDLNKKIILYAPTWRGESFRNPKNSVEDMINFRDEILKLIDKNKYQVLLKPHQLLGKLFKEYGVTDYIIPSTFDAGEALSITDILIGDFSSIYFDFLTTKRPILFYIPDEDEYKEERGIYFGLDELPAEYTDDIETVANWINNIEQWQIKNNSKYQKVRDFCQNCDKQNISKNILDIVVKGSNQGNIIKQNITKKRILMFKSTPVQNGIGSSSFNLLNYIDYDKYDVTLFMYNPTNQEQKNHVNQVNLNCRVMLKIGTYSSSLFEQVVLRLSTEYCESFKFIKQMFPKTAFQQEVKRCFGNTEFDYLIDFEGYSRVLALISLQIPTKKKYIWQHNDMQGEMEMKYKWLNHLFSLYKYYDGIVSCAESTMKLNRKKLSYLGLDDKFIYATNLFDGNKVDTLLSESKTVQINEKIYLQAESTKNQLRYIPLELENKIISKITYLDENIDDEQPIIVTGKVWKNGVTEAKILEFTKEQLDVETKFITVGRSSPEKNHRALVDAFDMLLKEYPNISLYIVGYGKDFDKEYNYILNKKLNNRIIMTNNIKNPFSLMKKCDCFILPSLHEGSPMVVLEARMLNMPIILSNFDTADSVSMENGQLIVEKDKESIYQGMKDFIDGNVPCDYHFDVDAYNKKCYSEFETLFE